MKKKLLITLLTTLTLVTCLPTMTLAADIDVSQSSSTEIKPYGDDIGYQYRLINDVVYKRLYNFTTEVALGPWMRA